MFFFLISSMVLGLLDQLQIFLLLYLKELLGLLRGLGLLKLWHLIYPRLFTEFGMLVFFTNISLMEFQVRYLALFLLFLVDFNAEKTQMLSFDQSNYTSSINVKMDGSVLVEKSSFKMLGLDWIGALPLSLFLKLPPRKLEP